MRTRVHSRIVIGLEVVTAALRGHAPRLPVARLGRIHVVLHSLEQIVGIYGDDRMALDGRGEAARVLLPEAALWLELSTSLSFFGIVGAVQKRSTS